MANLVQLVHPGKAGISVNPATTHAQLRTSAVPPLRSVDLDGDTKDGGVSTGLGLKVGLGVAGSVLLLVVLVYLLKRFKLLKCAPVRPVPSSRIEPITEE